MIKIIDNITVILWRWTHRIKKDEQYSWSSVDN